MTREILIAVVGGVITAVALALLSNFGNGNGNVISWMGGAKQREMEVLQRRTLVEDTLGDNLVSTATGHTEARLGIHDFCTISDVNVNPEGTGKESNACGLDSAQHFWTLTLHPDASRSKMPLSCTAKCFSFVDRPMPAKP